MQRGKKTKKGKNLKTFSKQVAQLSQRDRAKGCVRFGQKLKILQFIDLGLSSITVT